MFKFRCKVERFLWPKCTLCGLAVPPTGFTCNMCPSGTAFTYEAQLYVHMRDVHCQSIPPIIICELCDNTFSCTEKLLEHILVEKHSCFSDHLPCDKSSNCLTLFETQDDLDEHIKTKHAKPTPFTPSDISQAKVQLTSTPNASTNFIMHTAPFLSVNLNSNFVTPQSSNPLASQSYNYWNCYNQTPRATLFTPETPQPVPPPQTTEHLQTQIQPLQYPKFTDFTSYNPSFSSVSNSAPFSKTAAPFASVAAQHVTAANHTAKPSDVKSSAQVGGKSSTAFSQSSAEEKRWCNDFTSDDVSGINDFNYYSGVRKCFLCNFSISVAVLKKTFAKCPACNKKFASTLDMVNHLMDFHKEPGPIPPRLHGATAACHQPGCLFADSQLPIMPYIQHMERFHPKRPDTCGFHHICEHCFQLFGSHGSLAGHMQCSIRCQDELTDNYIQLLQCEKCSRLCSATSYTKCSFCQAKIADEREALFHIQEKHTGVVAKFKKYSKMPPGSTQCPVHFMCGRNGCRRMIPDKSDLDKHVSSCHFDAKKFASEAKSVLGRNNFESTSSAIETPGSTSITSSQNPVAIPDETSFECNLCGFLKIIEEQSLKACQLCSSNFLTANEVVMHILLDHSIEEQAQINEPNLPSCPFEECGIAVNKVTFLTLQSLFEHVKNKHQRVSQCLIHYICLDNSCGRLFSNKLLLKTHEKAKLKRSPDSSSSATSIFCADCLKSVDKSEIHTCTLCNVEVTGDLDMMNHLKNNHSGSLDQLWLPFFHCNVAACNDFFKFQDYINHRKSKHRFCTEHYVCLNAQCNAQMFSNLKKYQEHQRKCSLKSASKKGNVSGAEIEAAAVEAVHEELGGSPEAKRRKSSSQKTPPIELAQESVSSSSKSTSLSKNATPEKAAEKSNTWDDVMDRMLSYTNSLM